ncbi:MAG: WD40 repeat domain-containing protein [Pirellula sp.]
MGQKGLLQLKVSCLMVFLTILCCPQRMLIAQIADERTWEVPLLVQPPESLQPRLGRIANILVDRCVGCHDAQDAQGGYSMSTPAMMLTPGETKRVILGAASVDSEGQIVAFPNGLGELWERISTNDPALRMPKDSDALDPDQIEEIRSWIVTGAKVDGSMEAPIESFRPLYIPSEPKLASYPRPHTVQSIALDATNQTLFTSGYHEVLLWRWSDKMELIGRIATPGRSISDLHWDPVQSCLWIVSGEPGRIGYVESIPFRDFKPDTNPKARRVAWISRDTPLDICVSPSGELVAIGNADGTIVVVDTYSNSVRWKTPAHAAAVTSVDWSRDSKTLLSSSRDRMAKSFQAQDGTMLSSFVDNERTVASIVGLSKGVVVFDEAGTVRFYPNATTPNARTKWGGFAQQTHKLIAYNDDFFVIDTDRIKHFRVRREEIEVPEEPDKEKKDDDKKEEKKKKKKTEFYIDEKPGIRLTDPQDPARRLLPLSMQASVSQIDGQQELSIAIGCAGGEVFLWSPSNDSIISASNRP